MQDLVGQTIGQYEIVEKLGRGGMANVYKAFHPGLAVHRALKVIRPDLSTGKGFEERFQLEARAVAGLKHPNIVQMHDFGRHGDLFYMVMEFVDGEDLKARITRDGPIRPFSEAVRIVEHLAMALGAAHERNVLHRDVKPDNVMLGKDGSVILTDFGIAKIVGSQDPALTAAGSNIGTPAYMAPELASGQTEASPAADLYAVGVVFYEMLTAEAPFAADTPLAVLHRVLHDPVKPPREFTGDIPDALQGVVLKAMAFDPAHRYPSAEAFVEAARQSLLGVGPEVPPQVSTQPALGRGDGVAKTVPVAATQAVPEAGQEATRNRAPWIAAGLVLVLLALLGVSAVLGWRWLTDGDRLDTLALLGLGEETEAQALAGAVPGSDPRDPLTGGNESFFDQAEAEVSQGGGAETTNAGPRDSAGAVAGGAEDPVSAGNGGAAASPGAGEGVSAGAGHLVSTNPGSDTSASGRAGRSPSTGGGANEGAGRASIEAARRARREAGIQPLPAERFGGTLRFGAPTLGELEPEETVSYDLEVRRPTHIYFHIVYMSRPAWFVLRDADGAEVFREGSDVGPLRLDRPGWYSLSIETEASIPVAYEIEFRQVGG